MNTLIFAPQFNSFGRKDATGAFQLEANAFARYHSIPFDRVFFLNNKLSRATLREMVLDAVDLHKPDSLAFFCHGFKTGVQLGFDLNNLDMGDFSVTNPHIVLYACSTAKGNDKNGNGGFADMLRDSYCKRGYTNIVIDAHFTAGHTTFNPNVRRFEGRGSMIGGCGGQDIVSPAKPEMWAKWRKLLKNTTFRFAFPFLSTAEIYSILDGNTENLYSTI